MKNVVMSSLSPVDVGVSNADIASRAAHQALDDDPLSAPATASLTPDGAAVVGDAMNDASKFVDASKALDHASTLEAVSMALSSTGDQGPSLADGTMQGSVADLADGVEKATSLPFAQPLSSALRTLSEQTPSGSDDQEEGEEMIDDGEDDDILLYNTYIGDSAASGIALQNRARFIQEELVGVLEATGRLCVYVPSKNRAVEFVYNSRFQALQTLDEIVTLLNDEEKLSIQEVNVDTRSFFTTDDLLVADAGNLIDSPYKITRDLLRQLYTFSLDVSSIIASDVIESEDLQNGTVTAFMDHANFLTRRIRDIVGENSDIKAQLRDSLREMIQVRASLQTLTEKLAEESRKSGIPFQCSELLAPGSSMSVVQDVVGFVRNIMDQNQQVKDTRMVIEQQLQLLTNDRIAILEALKHFCRANRFAASIVPYDDIGSGIGVDEEAAKVVKVLESVTTQITLVQESIKATQARLSIGISKMESQMSRIKNLVKISTADLTAVEGLQKFKRPGNFTLDDLNRGMSAILCAYASMAKNLIVHLESTVGINPSIDPLAILSSRGAIVPFSSSSSSSSSAPPSISNIPMGPSGNSVLDQIVKNVQVSLNAIRTPKTMASGIDKTHFQILEILTAFTAVHGTGLSKERELYLGFQRLLRNLNPDALELQKLLLAGSFGQIAKDSSDADRVLALISQIWDGDMGVKGMFDDDGGGGGSGGPGSSTELALFTRRSADPTVSTTPVIGDVSSKSVPHTPL
jgi:prefoldin subunit 5